VLVVDDEPGIRATLREMLTRSGCDVTEAPHGMGALVELAAPHNMLPDLVILDVSLPLEGGVRVLRFLRETRRSDLPVIVLTGTASEEQEQELQQLGIDAYLRKPAPYETLLAEVERTLGRRQQK
jgi:DNA-binding response OmpR family regulator